MPYPILVHVGYHKTATTWLQNQLFNNNDFGYDNPWGNQAGLAVDAFVVQNPFRFDPKKEREAFVQGMTEASQKSLVPVLSNEAMCGMEGPRLRYERQVADRVYEVLPDAKILITIRKQENIIISHYREAIARGATYTVEEYLNKPVPEPGFAAHCQIDHFEYDLMVKYYMDLFGVDNVLVLPQEQLKTDRQGFCDKLADFVDLPRKQIPESQGVRVGNKGGALLYRRWCNSVNLGVRKPGASGRLISRVVDKLGAVIGQVTPDAWNRSIEDHLKRVVNERVGNYFADSNERLQGLTGLDLGVLGYTLPQKVGSTHVAR